MKSLVFFVSFFFLFTLNLATTRRNYVVYMGSSKTSASRDTHRELVRNVTRTNEGGNVLVYQHSFLGFAAPLSVSEAEELAVHPGVVSVFPDSVLTLHTTRSWDFLEVATSVYHRVPKAASMLGKSDVIVGIMDTGIWPESKSFDDKHMGPIPSRWRGECMEGTDFRSTNCNRKLIGARYYDLGDSEAGSPRDTFGHGTHVASTAAGNPVNASLYGIAAGIAKGANPSIRIASYKVCGSSDCIGSAVLAAFDDAIKDGVNVLSLSFFVGEPRPRDPLFKDPISIGSFHAVLKGITVVCAAGNDGPTPQSIVNIAPWVITVGETTIDRFFESRVVLGSMKVLKGQGINFSALKKSPVYGLVDGRNNETRICEPESRVDMNRVKGKIALCNRFYDPEQLRSAGAVGVIVFREKLRSEAQPFGLIPGTEISSKDGLKISAYIRSSRNPVATILATRSVFAHKPAPVVSRFSSRGPVYGLTNLIKPDIVAPGVQILASWIGNDTSLRMPGKPTSQFNLISGTSMACPHVSGIIATIKSHYPAWTPAMLRSAIMTTAIPTNNLNEPISTEPEGLATPYDMGAGLVSSTRGTKPGIVYKMGHADYYHALCYIGYNLTTIKLIAGKLPKGFSCHKNSSFDMISNLNYPSIAVSWNDGHPITVERTVSNIIGCDRVYTLAVEAPPGLIVNVVPGKLSFTEGVKKLKYNVTFCSSPTSSPLPPNIFGAITWTSGEYKVRTPFAVTNLKA